MWEEKKNRKKKSTRKWKHTQSLLIISINQNKMVSKIYLISFAQEFFIGIRIYARREESNNKKPTEILAPFSMLRRTFCSFHALLLSNMHLVFSIWLLNDFDDLPKYFTLQIIRNTKQWNIHTNTKSKKIYLFSSVCWTVAKCSERIKIVWAKQNLKKTTQILLRN